MKRFFHVLILSVAIAFPVAIVSGCAANTNAMGSVSLSPQTFDEKLAAGLALNAGVRQTATDLLTARKISADDAQNVLTATDAARAGLDVARTLSKTDMTAADGRLNAVRTGLTALSAYLATRK